MKIATDKNISICYNYSCLEKKFRENFVKMSEGLEGYNPWDTVAANYYHSIKEQIDYAHQFVILPTLIRELTEDFVWANEIKEKPVLDLGCGNGLLMCSLAQEFPGLQIVGVDNSNEMLSKARSNVYRFIKPGDGAEVSFVKGDAQRLSIEDSSFSIVLQVMLLQSINDEEVVAVIKETRRLLRSGGDCYVVIPHPNLSSISRFRNLSQIEGGEQYLLHKKLQYDWKDQKGEVLETTDFFVRPFQFYVNSFAREGFGLIGMWEPSIENTEEAFAAKPHIFLQNIFNTMFAVLKFVKLSDQALKSRYGKEL